MAIVIGIDDTDLPDTEGTNQLARRIADALPDGLACDVVLRHQLLLDPRIPYTSGNGSASIGCAEVEGAGGGVGDAGHGGRDGGDDGIFEHLVETVREAARAFAPDGSDPGICLARLGGPPDGGLLAFGRRCQREPVEQCVARTLAADLGIHLEGLGGTEGGVIGALAAVALRAGGDDGRVVHKRGWPWPDPFSGEQPVDAILARGVDEVRVHETGEAVTAGTVDLGRRLRPAFRGHRVVLFVEPTHSRASGRWTALKLP